MLEYQEKKNVLRRRYRFFASNYRKASIHLHNVESEKVIRNKKHEA
jgi:hypothetical protein